MLVGALPLTSVVPHGLQTFRNVHGPLVGVRADEKRYRLLAAFEVETRRRVGKHPAIDDLLSTPSY